jgi:uncharacterized protein YjiS (DUF1127 family)
MITLTLLAALRAWAHRLHCRWTESRRLRRDLALLSSMNSHELSDIGISHASVISGAAMRDECCA